MSSIRMLNEEEKVIRILEAIDVKKDSCRTGEGLSILEDLENELNQELKDAQAWLRDMNDAEG